MHVSTVCQRCKEQIEWKIKYKKYKPLSQAKTCTHCKQRTVKKAKKQEKGQDQDKDQLDDEQLETQERAKRVAHTRDELLDKIKQLNLAEESSSPKLLPALPSWRPPAPCDIPKLLRGHEGYRVSGKGRTLYLLAIDRFSLK